MTANLWHYNRELFWAHSSRRWRLKVAYAVFSDLFHTDDIGLEPRNVPEEYHAVRDIVMTWGRSQGHARRQRLPPEAIREIRETLRGDRLGPTTPTAGQKGKKGGKGERPPAKGAQKGAKGESVRPRPKASSAGSGAGRWSQYSWTSPWWAASWGSGQWGGRVAHMHHLFIQAAPRFRRSGFMTRPR